MTRLRFTSGFAALALLWSSLPITSQQNPTVPTRRVAEELQQQPILLGTAWYPEQWPEARWEVDLTLMQQAHMHVVRVAEFAWSTMEPQEGHFDFAWLDRAIALAARHDIKVVLGTPTAAPPAWLTSKYPETLRVNEDGRREEHGNRQQFSFSDPTYRRLAARIAAEMARHYGHNPNVLGWQLDNELAAPSFDPSAKAAFHRWLRVRYGSIGNLNQRWATAYWSQTYDTFDQVPVHSTNQNPALLLDWKRFVTDTWLAYCKNQIDAMRPFLAPTQWITTNTMHWFQGFDHYKLHSVLDLAAWDDYYPDGHLDPVYNAVQNDLVRGFKQQNFWLMETQPAFVNWGPVNAALPPGVTREMAWQGIGHGADAVLYWQWRPAPNGQEEYHGSLLGADGTPVPVYYEVQQIGADLERAGTALQHTSPYAEVAILQDYDSHWAIDFQRHTVKFDYQEGITDLYRALTPSPEGGVDTLDIVSPLAELSKYRLVFAPALNVLPTATAQHLLAYVHDGGTLILGPRTGMKNEDNGLQLAGQPGPLIQAVGARVEQYYALDKPVTVAGTGIASGQATVWAEALGVLAPDEKVLLTYQPSGGWLDGKAAAVAHPFGSGTVVYLGATLDVPTLRKMLLPLLAERQVGPLVRNLPAGVELMQRTGPTHRVWILLNHDVLAKHLSLPIPGRDLLGPTPGATTTQIDLPPHGVAVFQVEVSSEPAR